MGFQEARFYRLSSVSGWWLVLLQNASGRFCFPFPREDFEKCECGHSDLPQILSFCQVL